MLGNVYGLDLGTYEIKVYDKKHDNMWKEKNAIAIQNKDTVFSVGDSAYEMYEKAPYNIEIIFPMKEGVISHFYDMQYLLQNLLKRGRKFVPGSKYIVAVPIDVTEVEKRAFYDLVVHSTAKAKDVRIVERGFADAVGLNLDVKNSPGIFVVNIGGETTELTILSYDGIVVNKMLKIGGRSLDQGIINAVRADEEYLLGRQTAEELRNNTGVIGNVKSEKKVAGRNLHTGVPELRVIEKDIVRKGMSDVLKTLIFEIQCLLERTPPEVQRNVMRNGIHLTGGVANVAGLKDYLQEQLGIKIVVSKQPEFSTVNGLKKIIQTKELQKHIYSMLDDNYRWMR